MTVLHVSAASSLVHAAALILNPSLLWTGTASHIISLVAPGARDDPPTGLLLEVVGDRVIDLAQFGVSVSILAVFVPLAEPFVLKVTTLLRLESLIDLAHFKLWWATSRLLLTRHHGLLLGHLLRLLLLHLLLLEELLLCLAGHGHLSRLRCLLLLYYLLRVCSCHLSCCDHHLLLGGGVRSTSDCYAYGHGHLLGGAANHGVWHGGFKLLLALLVRCCLLLVLLLR